MGCETDEPVSPTPLEPVDTVLEDTTELRSLLLGTWVKFEGSGVGDGIPYFVTPEYTHTFRQDDLVDIRDIESDSLICQEQYKLWFKVNRVYEIPHFFDGTRDSLWFRSNCENTWNTGGAFGFRSDSVFSIGFEDSHARYHRIEQ